MTCKGIGNGILLFECRWALGGLGPDTRDESTQYSPVNVTDAAGRNAACLLALEFDAAHMQGLRAMADGAMGCRPAGAMPAASAMAMARNGGSQSFS